MKIKITKPDGTVIEAEGTAEECARLMGDAPQPAPFVVPYIQPRLWWQSPFTYTVGTGGVTSTGFVGYNEASPS